MGHKQPHGSRGVSLPMQGDAHLICQELMWHRTSQAQVHTLPQLLSSFFCLDGSQGEDRAAASTAQTGEAPINPIITLNSESERGSTDLSTDLNALVSYYTLLQDRRERDSPSKAIKDAAGQPRTLHTTQLTLDLHKAETPLSAPFTLHQQHFCLCPALTLLPIVTPLPSPFFLSSCSLPECNRNEASSTPIS